MHASPPLRRETPAAGPSFLAAATTSSLPDNRLQDIQGLLNIDPNLVILPPARRDLRGHPYKVLQGASHRRIRGSLFSVWVVKYWNKRPASVVTAPSVKVFQKRLEKVWTSPPFPSPLPCIPPINSYHLYMLPNSLLYICGFFSPVVSYFLPL